MFKSIFRPVRVSRFSKTVSFPQNNSSSIPANRHGFNFDKPPGSRCLAQPPASSRSRTTPAVISGIEQTQRSPRTVDLIAHARGRANSNPCPTQTQAQLAPQSHSRPPRLPLRATSAEDSHWRARTVTDNRPKRFGRFVLPSAVPIILVALLFFVLLSAAGFILLSLVLRYRAGTARRQGRRWVAGVNLWMTQPLGCPLSLLRLPDLLLARHSFSVCSDWYGFWSHSWLARFGDDPLGNPTGRTFLHSEPLARASCYAGNRSTFCLRLVARHALRQRHCQQSILVDECFR